eukprot:Rmarinus@m.27897
MLNPANLDPLRFLKTLLLFRKVARTMVPRECSSNILSKGCTQCAVPLTTLVRVCTWARGTRCLLVCQWARLVHNLNSVEPLQLRSQSRARLKRLQARPPRAKRRKRMIKSQNLNRLGVALGAPGAIRKRGVPPLKIPGKMAGANPRDPLRQPLRRQRPNLPLETSPHRTKAGVRQLMLVRALTRSRASGDLVVVGVGVGEGEAAVGMPVSRARTMAKANLSHNTKTSTTTSSTTREGAVGCEAAEEAEAVDALLGQARSRASLTSRLHRRSLTKRPSLRSTGTAGLRARLLAARPRTAPLTAERPRPRQPQGRRAWRRRWRKSM